MENNTNNLMPSDENRLNPWFSMWLQPRATMRQILDSGSYGPVAGIAAIAGIADAFGRAGDRNLDADASLFGMLLVAVIGGAIGGLIGLYLWSALVKWTGKWLGGSGSYAEIVAAIAWSNIPIIWSLIPWTIAILILGKNVFINSSVIPYSSFFLSSAFIFNTIIFAIGIWYIFINLKCIAEAQRFSTWMALANMILAALILIVPLIIIALIAALAYI